MRKLLTIIIVIVIAIVSFALFYYQSKLTPSATVPPPTAVQKPKALPFDSNDNINQALDDLKTLDGLGIE